MIGVFFIGYIGFVVVKKTFLENQRSPNCWSTNSYDTVQTESDVSCVVLVKKTFSENQRSTSISTTNSDDTIQTQSDISSECSSTIESKHNHSDSDSSSECSSTIESHHNHLSSGRLGEAARIEQLIKSQNITGTKNYRPLIGGFAAAAYEAMKEHHYLNKESRLVNGRGTSNKAS